MFEENTYEKILDRMLMRVSKKFDKREGSVIFDTHSPTALELAFLYIELERVIKEAYGDTASREFLILRCKERGISPYPASNAVLKGVFEPKNIDVSGKRFNLGELNYVVDEKLSEGEYKVKCETEGRIGGSFLGELTPIDYIDSLQRAELTEVLIPGEDQEDTEELRKRYFASFDERAFGGNRQDYLDKTNAIAGVGQTKVTRLWNGDISPLDMIPNDEVKSWYEEFSENTDTPESVKTWLKAVYTAAKEKKLTTGGTVLLTILNSDFEPASKELVNTVQTVIDPVQNGGEGYGFAPIGHLVTVKSAEGVNVDIAADFTFGTGYDFEGIQESLENAAREYLSELRKDWGSSPYIIVRISQLEARLLAVKGVVDIGATEINGKAENLVLSSYQVPVFGSIGEVKESE